MNLQHGEKKKLAKWLGLKKSDLSSILSGRYRPGKNKAERLESLTGISFNDWLRLPHNQLKELVYEIWESHKKEKL